MSECHAKQAIATKHNKNGGFQLTYNTSCLEPRLFFSWGTAHQQVLNVILEHDNNEEAAQDNSLGNDVLVCHPRQVGTNEDVGNAQGQCSSAQ